MDSVDEYDLCVGSFLWLPSREKCYRHELWTKCISCSDNSNGHEISPYSYNHPVVILRLGTRYYGKNKRERICTIAMLTSFRNLDILSYYHYRKSPGDKFGIKHSLPVAYKSSVIIAESHSLPYFTLEGSIEFKKQPYIKWDHIYDIPTASLVPFEIENSIHPRLDRSSYQLLLEQAGLLTGYDQTYDSDDEASIDEQSTKSFETNSAETYIDYDNTDDIQMCSDILECRQPNLSTSGIDHRRRSRSSSGPSTRGRHRRDRSCSTSRSRSPHRQRSTSRSAASRGRSRTRTPSSSSSRIGYNRIQRSKRSGYRGHSYGPNPAQDSTYAHHDVDSYAAAAIEGQKMTQKERNEEIARLKLELAGLERADDLENGRVKGRWM